MNYADILQYEMYLQQAGHISAALSTAYRSSACPSRSFAAYTALCFALTEQAAPSAKASRTAMQTDPRRHYAQLGLHPDVSRLIFSKRSL